MANVNQVVDQIVKTTEGVYQVYFADITGEAGLDTIENYIKTRLTYSDLTHAGAPELPNASSNPTAYQSGKIKPFNKIAFTGNYNDLTNKPTQFKIEDINITDLLKDADWDEIDLPIQAQEISYEDLIAKPTLPENGISYDENENIQYNSFHTISFSGDYNDLINKINVPENNGNNTDLYTGNLFTGTLTRLAFTGNYNDLIMNAPQLPANNQNNANLYSGNNFIGQLQKLAFTGTYNDLINAPALPIEAWDENENLLPFHSVAFTGDYGDIVNSPRLPDNITNTDLYNNNNNFIGQLHRIAFTGEYEDLLHRNISYDDLINAPTIPDVNGNRPSSFHEIAFTGQIETATIVNSITNILELNRYIASSIPNQTSEWIETNNQKLQNIGKNDVYILNINYFQENNLSGTGYNLENQLTTFIGHFLRYKIGAYIITNDYTFLITNIKVEYAPGQVNPSHYVMQLTSICDNNYNTLNAYHTGIGNDIVDETEAQTILNNLTITPIIGQLIYDVNNHVIYYKKVVISNN